MSLGCMNTTGCPCAPILGVGSSSRASDDTCATEPCGRGQGGRGQGGRSAAQRHAPACGSALDTHPRAHQQRWRRPLEPLPTCPRPPLSHAHGASALLYTALHCTAPGLHRTGLYVGDLQADVVHAPRRVALQEPGNGRRLAQRVQQLNGGVGQAHKHHAHAVLRQVLRRADLLAAGVGGRVGVGCGGCPAIGQEPGPREGQSQCAAPTQHMLLLSAGPRPRRTHLCTQHPAVLLCCGRQVGHSHGHVV